MKSVHIFSLTILLLGCSIPQKSFSQNEVSSFFLGTDIFRKKDRCYQNCLIPDRYNVEKITYPFYTGSDPTAPLEVIEIAKSSEKVHWVRKGDMYCLQKSPPEIEKITCLKDTIAYKTFEYKSYTKRTLVSKGGKHQNIEIICPEKFDDNLSNKLASALQEKGYLEKETKVSDNILKTALENYCKDYGFPENALSIALLQQLGVL